MTTEDLLEAFVGNIEDEHDAPVEYEPVRLEVLESTDRLTGNVRMSVVGVVGELE